MVVMVSSIISSSDLHQDDQISLEKLIHHDEGLDDHDDHHVMNDIDDDIQYDSIWSTRVLDIPQDKLEDIELFPNFGDDFMSLPELTLTPLPPPAAHDHPSLSVQYNQLDHRQKVCHNLQSMIIGPYDTTLDHQNNIFCDSRQSMSPTYDQYHSQLPIKICDSQRKLIPHHSKPVDICTNQSQSTNYEYLNHSNINTAEVRDNRSITTTYENHSNPVEVFDNAINYRPSKVYNIHSNTAAAAAGYSTAMLYGQELCGFQKKKMRSKRAFPPRRRRRSTGPTENSKRKCTHCQTEATPQWRMGPRGPNTLCNACGVRYQTGRLLPEYRPAASPTFDVSKHSNFHKRILKRKAMIS